MRTWPCRPITEDEYDAFAETLQLALGSSPSAEVHAHQRGVFEADRSIAAFDGDTIVGCAGAYSMTLTVPGGVTRATGLGLVAVRPTHRARGVAHAMAHWQMKDLHERGESVAVAVALQPSLWGVYGYGLGGYKTALRIPHNTGLRLHPKSADRTLRIVDAKESAQLCEPVYARQLGVRPGMAERDGRWLSYALTGAWLRGGGVPLRCVVAEDHGNVSGYAWYSVRQGWERTGPSNDVLVHEAYADDPASLAELWRFLLSQDHASAVTVPSLPVDHPLLLWLAEPRRAQSALQDAMIVRLLDVGKALAARRYARAVDAVFELDDTYCPWNAGRWRLSADAAGAVCERTTAPADLTMNVRELAAGYFGGISLRSLAAAGLVRGGRPDVTAVVSEAFRHDPAPWLSVEF